MSTETDETAGTMEIVDEPSGMTEERLSSIERAAKITDEPWHDPNAVVLELAAEVRRLRGDLETLQEKYRRDTDRSVAETCMRIARESERDRCAREAWAAAMKQQTDTERADAIAAAIRALP